jgi:hypothetical protein
MLQSVRFEVLKAASMKMAVFWVVALCSLVEVYWRFRGARCLHHQGDEDALLLLFQCESPGFLPTWFTGITLGLFPKNYIKSSEFSVYGRGGQLPELQEPHLSSHFDQEPQAFRWHVVGYNVQWAQNVHMKSPPLTNQSKWNLRLIETRALQHSVEQLRKFIFFFFLQRSCRQSVAALLSTINKMASPRERAECLVWFSETKSPITVQKNYRRIFEKDPPDKRPWRPGMTSFWPQGVFCSSQVEAKNARLTKRWSMSWRPFREVRQSRFVERHLSSTPHV